MDSIRKALEAFLIHKDTLEPAGLNKRDEMQFY